jgi:hypothetical protein
MSNMTQFGAELKIGGQESAIDAESKVAALKQAVLELATSYDQGEIGQAEFSTALKELNAQLRANAQAASILATAQREQAQEAARSAAAAAAAVEESAAEYRQLAAAKAQAVSAELADQAEREALAIQHETEMLAHEQRQLVATAAAEDHEIAALQKSITARDAVEREASELAAALAREAAAHDTAEAQAEQLTSALHLEGNALYLAAVATGSYTVEASAAASAQGKLATASKATRAVQGQLQQSITAASFAFQDFTATSGDLGAKLNSISNNLPTLLMGLGGIGQVIAVAATAGIAIYRNWDQIAGFWETRNPFPKAEHDIAGMKREVDAAKESLEKMEKAGTGNAAQLEKYNELRARTAELETEIADQTERQSRLKKVMESQTDEAEGRVKGFTEATKGRGAETLNKIALAYQAELAAELEAAWKARTLSIQAIAASSRTDEEKLKAADSINAIWKETKKRIQESDPAALADQLMDRLLTGEQDAFKSLDRLIKSTGELFGDMKKKMDEANPHLKKVADDVEKELEGEVKAIAEAAKARKKLIDAQAEIAWQELKAQLDADDAEFKARDKAQKKIDDAKAKKAKEELAEADRRNQAEAKRIQAVAGKGFGAEVAMRAEATGGDPEAIAAKLAAQLVKQFTASPKIGGLGATQGGAQLAAQQLAAGAGFRVTPSQMDQVERDARAARAAAQQPRRRRRLPDQIGGKLPDQIGGGLPDQIGGALPDQIGGPARAKGPGVAELAKPVGDTQAALARMQAEQARDRQIIAQLSANAARLNNRNTEFGPTAQPSVGLT